MLTNDERIRANVEQATTEDLLDRVTVYREGMEPEALEMIETELHHRGIAMAEIEAHLARRRELIRRPDGSVVECSFCRRPAIVQRWGWDRLRGRWFAALLPLYRPRFLAYCADHLPERQEGAASAGDGPLTSEADPRPPGG